MFFNKPCKGLVSYANISNSTHTKGTSSTSVFSLRVKTGLRIIKCVTKLYYKNIFLHQKTFFLSFPEKTLVHSYAVTLNPVTSSFSIFPHMHTPNFRCCLSLFKSNISLTVNPLRIPSNYLVE